MEFFLIWIVLSFVIASYGDKRKIGFGVALLVCLFLSPLIGFVCVALSERKNSNNDDPHKEESTGFDIEKFRRN